VSQVASSSYDAPPPLSLANARWGASSVSSLLSGHWLPSRHHRKGPGVLVVTIPGTNAGPDSEPHVDMFVRALVEFFKIIYLPFFY
jgi:hypothetical protein